MMLWSALLKKVWFVLRCLRVCCVRRAATGVGAQRDGETGGERAASKNPAARRLDAPRRVSAAHRVGTGKTAGIVVFCVLLGWSIYLVLPD